MMSFRSFAKWKPSAAIGLVLAAGLASGCAAGRAADNQFAASADTTRSRATPAAPEVALRESAAAVPAVEELVLTAGRPRWPTLDRTAPAPEPRAAVRRPAPSPSTRTWPDGELLTLQAPATAQDFSREAALPSLRPVRVDSTSVDRLDKPTVLLATAATFEQQVLRSDVPVLVDFYADWCGPCRAIAPVLQQVAEELPHARVVKVNIDDSPDLAARFGIESIPSLLVFEGGRVVSRQTGAKNKAQLKALLGG